MTGPAGDDELDAAAQVGVTPLRVLEELGRIAFFDLGSIYDDNGHLIPVHLMDEDARRAIGSIDVEEVYDGRGVERMLTGVVRKVRTYDKLKALQILAQHLGMLVVRQRIETNDDLAELIRLARQRARELRAQESGPVALPAVAVSADPLPTPRGK